MSNRPKKAPYARWLTLANLALSDSGKQQTVKKPAWSCPAANGKEEVGVDSTPSKSRGEKTVLRMMTATHVLAAVDAIQKAGVRVWVNGGWGIEALLGHQTRTHGSHAIGYSGGML